MLLEQAKTGTVTLTDERMTRFWMTLGDAVRLVRRAAEGAPPGTTLIPDLPAVRIPDLIAAVVPNAKVRTIGIRASEKLHECLISEDEAPYADRLGGNYILGLPKAQGISERYASDNRGGFLTIAEIRDRLPQAMAEAE